MTLAKPLIAQTRASTSVEALFFVVGLVTEISRRHGYAHQASFRMELVPFLLPKRSPGATWHQGSLASASAGALFSMENQKLMSSP